VRFDPSWVGRTLAGRFTITGAIGAGGMAQVVRGFDPGTLREVAIKILDPAVGRNRTVLKRFQREARVVAEFSHRNVVEVFDAGVDGDLHFIVMEFLEGRDLFEAMTGVSRLDEARAARIVAQICDALAAAHARGIVHRDLKPENVMLVDDPEAPGEEMVKVLDFGVAKILDVGADAGPARSSMRTAITGVGTILGTPGYMSPEQGRLEPVDSRTDIYACGVILYQLVTGRLPFDGETPLQILAKHVQEEPPPPRTWLSDIHPGLEAAIARAMAKRPGDRHQSATELGDALRAILPELPSSQRESLPAPPRTRSSRRPVPLVRIGSPLAAAATLGGSAPPPPPARAESVDDAATTLIRKDRQRKTSTRDR
jgi:serine/threonine protein kinase